ncbi:hypothetical protein MRS44_005674 [Fusarium solani]|uniref:uncharacterized protein n=1 Tax=Fusarium solani TaxID=169388 RepID=UPI0032C4AA9C|nr:hypothetical protein MRS44_005674 [Fusarium solani]
MEAAASIAGLVSLADLVFRYSLKYVKSSKGARKEVEDVSREIGDLSLVLHRLSFVAFRLAEAQSSDATEAPSNVTLHLLYKCEELLTRLRGRLDDAKSDIGSDSRFESLRGSLKWPFSSTETKEILQGLERQKQTMSHAMAADSWIRLTSLLSQQSNMISEINEVQATAKKILDIETKIVLDRKRKGVLKFFTKTNPYSEFNTNRELRQGLTGLWLTRGPEFEEWYTTRGSKIWCSGIPGAGKSVLAAAMVDECLQRNAPNPGTALAYFFCTYRDEITQEPISILSSLCSQLARQDENAFEILREYHDELTSERQLQAGPSTKKLIKILRRMCSSFDRVYLIVDGLDECAEQVEECVGSLAALLPSPEDETLNLALLSRDEFPIQEILKDQFQNVKIEAHTEDIDRYVTRELDQRIALRKLRLKDLALKDKIRARLVNGASGMFRWVACQLDHLCGLPTDGARERALNDLPPTLPATYERILARINKSHEQIRQLVQRTLLLISSPHHRHLSLRQICEAISLQDGWEELPDEDIVDGEEVLRYCGSLVRTRKVSHGNEGCDEVGIEFSHFSVKEYLQGNCLKYPMLSTYGVSREKACSLLASLCLDYLTLKSHEELLKAINAAEGKAIKAMDERDLRYPFYRHAATFWPFYAREAGEGCCLERIHDLFQLPKTPSFCSWAATLAAHSMSVDHSSLYRAADRWLETPSFSKMDAIFNPSHVVRPNFTPLHMAAALGMPELCDHLLKQGANVNLKGKFGTPLHCAIAGLGIFTFHGPESNLFDKANFFDTVGQLLGRRQSSQVLLSAKANPHLCFMGDQEEKYSSLSLAAMWLSYQNGLGVAAELVKARIAIGEEDLRHFKERYGDFWEATESCDEYSDRQGVVSLLEALGPPTMETKDTPASRLYAKTYNWATIMRVKDLDQISIHQSTAGFSDGEIVKLVTRWIVNNNGVELDRFLKSSRSELVKSTDVGIHIERTRRPALHLAVKYNSLDVLHVLLEYGLDANMADENGRTPAHFCNNVDELRVLLAYGASTLVPDKAQETVWHRAARKGDMGILNLLVRLEVRQEALQMVSSRNETPICSALSNRQIRIVLLLLKHCDSRAFWKSGKSIFRAAAEMGSPKIIKHLLDADIEVDGMDDITGNPLHYVPTYAPLECIRMLRDLFPLGQRRKQDLRTPLELFLIRAVDRWVTLERLGRGHLEVMLPDAAVSNSKEASILWSFLGLEVTRSVMSCQNSNTWTWLEDYACAFITLGIMAKYEEEREESGLLPFMSAVALTATKMYKTVLQAVEEPELYIRWDSFSDLMRHIMGQSRHWDSAVGKPDTIRLLSVAILYDDVEMVSLLIDKGVDMHSRLDELSPFEFACFPNVPVSHTVFALLLKHADPEKMTQRNELLNGCGPLHFCVGRNEGEGCAWKLKQMLGAGFDPNLPLSANSGSPLAFHIRKGAIGTTEMLLEAGADPWARGSYPFDAALEAVRLGHLSILAKIAAINYQSPCWDRTWVSVFGTKKFVGGNALHLAALNGTTECLEFYLSQGLLSDLECCDDVLETPMHYAARFGRSSTIEFIKARGGNINATNRNGITPLHLAADQGHLETAKTLINLGAEHQPCDRGHTPLVYAYAKGNESMIEALQSSSKEPQKSSSSIKSPGTLRLLAEAMRNAILRGDVAACERIHALGCPIDVELYDGVPVTPLAVAICHQQDPKIVQWLVDSGATVSTVFPQPYQGQYLTALEAAVAHPMFNSLLNKLLNKLLEEGGIFLDMVPNPLFLAVIYNNIEGLRILLDWLHNTNGSSRIVERSSSPREALSALVNQHQLTALHLAASRNNLEACAALIDSQADIEQVDAGNRTPLHFAALSGSLQVAKDLLSRGARANPLDLFAETPLMSAYQAGQFGLVDLLTPHHESPTSTNHKGESLLHFMTKFETDPARKEVALESFSRCIEQGASLYSRDTDGVTPMHWILASHPPCYLKSLLDRNWQFLRPHEMAQWPHSCFREGTHRLVAISKNLHLVRPSLSKLGLRQLCGVADSGNHNLLCRAAGWGLVEAIDNLLALGVDMIEHECNDHGTPLTAAVSNRQVEAVKCLVRNGATVSYDLCHPRDSRGRMASPDIVILQWLFFGRYMEQKRISNGTTEASDKVESWGGVCSVEVALKWEWKRLREESTRDYACRWQRILKDLRGKVVKCVGETDSKNGGSEGGKRI